MIKKQQEKREEEERRKKLLLNQQPPINYSTDIPSKVVNNGAIPPQNGVKGNEQGLSQQQMMEFGYMFLNGNIDDFLNNKSVSEE